MTQQISNPELNDPSADPALAINALSRIYLDAGLPLELAVRSALADYSSYVQTPKAQAA